MAEPEKHDAAYELVGYLNQMGEEDAAELVVRYANKHWTDYED